MNYSVFSSLSMPLLAVLFLAACGSDGGSSEDRKDSSNKNASPEIQWIKADIIHVPKDYNSSIGNDATDDRSIYMALYTSVTDLDGFEDVSEIWVENDGLKWFIKESNDLYDAEPNDYYRSWLYSYKFDTRVPAVGYTLYARDVKGNLVSSEFDIKKPNFSNITNETFIYGDLDEAMFSSAEALKGVEALGIPILLTPTISTVNLNGRFKYVLDDDRASYIRLSIFTEDHSWLCSYTNYTEFKGTTGNVNSDGSNEIILDFSDPSNSSEITCSDEFESALITLDEASYAVLNAYDNPFEDITDGRTYWHYRSISYWVDIVFE
jgi:hypothetical protein